MKFPAYGKRLMLDRLQGKIPKNSVVVSFDWKIGAFFPRVVIQKNVNPADLEYRYLAGLDVMLPYHTQDAERAEIALKTILEANPRSLLAFQLDTQQNIVVKNMAGEVFI